MYDKVRFIATPLGWSPSPTMTAMPRPAGARIAAGNASVAGAKNPSRSASGESSSTAPGSGPQVSGPLAAALDRVGDRWSFLLVEAMLDGPRRFNDLLEALPGLAPNILVDRLRRLEREGIVIARPYSQRPVRMAYELTAAALDLAGALRLLADWGAKRAPEGGHEPLRHEVCGTPLEARWYCPTCSVPVQERDLEDLRRV
jgi:DNA-binding HxlR family transcriptional regulator